MLQSRVRRLLIPALASLALAAACTGGDAPASMATPQPAVTTATPATTVVPEATAPPSPTPTPESYAFPTGPPVLVAADFEPPEDRVASTGAYIPSNGKPTLVFVDAIW